MSKKDKGKEFKEMDSDPQEKHRVDNILNTYVLFYESFDLDRAGSFALLAIFRFICTT